MKWSMQKLLENLLLYTIRKEVINMAQVVKNEKAREELIANIKDAATQIYNMADSIVEPFDILSDMSITIYLHPHEVPYINVDKDFVCKETIDRILKKED